MAAPADPARLVRRLRIALVGVAMLFGVALIAVLGRDCLAAAGRDGDLTAVLAALVTLRRALP